MSDETGGTPQMVVEDEPIPDEWAAVCWCPFCGATNYVFQRHHGTMCAGCGARVEVMERDRGYTVGFDCGEAEFSPKDREMRKPPSRWVFMEVVDAGDELVLSHVSAPDADGDWTPKRPTSYVRPNEDGPSKPQDRWIDTEVGNPVEVSDIYGDEDEVEEEDEEEDVAASTDT
jgi:hypothetical protein